MISLLKRYLVTIAILAIFILAVFLRFYQLEKFPVGFHMDEAIMSTNGYFILKTNRDTNNNFLPLQTEMFGDYNPMGYPYLTVLPIKQFGLNEFSARFPGVLLGSLTIFAFFLFTFVIFKDKKLALLSSLFLAIAPWHIILSRSSEQALVSLFFVISGFGLIILSLSSKRPLFFLLLGLFLLFISFFMYFTPRIFVLLIFPVFIFSFYSLIKHKSLKYKSILSGSFLVFVLFSLFLTIFIKGGENRFKQLSIFGFPETKLVMEEQIREDGVLGKNILETRIFHNKIVNYSLSYLSNYLDYFSGNFLFIKGGLPPWLKVSGMGLIYLAEAPFFLIGIINLVKSRNREYIFLILWLLVSPLIAAATVDEVPSIRRSFLMFPAIEIITAYGLLFFLGKVNFIKTFLILFIGLIFIFNFSYFLHQYFGHESVHRTWYRGNGVPAMIEEVKKVYNNYDKIIISKSQAMYPFILFYMKYDPQTYLLEGHTKDKEYTGFGKFFFVPQNCPAIDQDSRFPKDKHILYVNSPECKDNKLVSYKDIYREDGTKAFRLAYD